MPMTLIESLRAERAEKYQQAEEITNKRDRTEAETESARTLLGECRQLTKRIDSEESLEREFGQERHSRSSPVPNGRRGFGAADENGQAGGGLDRRRVSQDANPHRNQKFTFLGSAPAGETVLGWDGAGEMEQLHNVGAGTLGDQTWEAIQDPEYVQVFQKYLRKGERGLSNHEYHVLESGNDSAGGGVFAPPQLINEIINRKPTPTRLAGMVRNITASRDMVEFPSVGYADANNQYSSTIRFTWTGEKPTATSHGFNTDNDFGTIQIPVHTAMGSMPISRNLLEDQAFNVLGWFVGEINSSYDLLRDDMILNGSASGAKWQPKGLLTSTGTAADEVPTLNIGTTPTVDGYMDLLYGIEEQYDEDQMIVMRKTSTFAALAKIKTLTSGSNQLAFANGLNDSGLYQRRQPVLQGYPIAFSGFMPALSSGAKAVLTGDMKGYLLVNRIGVSIQTLKETKAKQNQDELVVRLRFGGAPIEPWRFRVGVAS